MGTEIERKFLVVNEQWRTQADAGAAYRQGYLVGGEKSSVRVRIEGDCAKLNIKSATLGIRRQEFEYPIPVEDAQEMLASLCGGALVEKTRYHVPVGDHVWEVDVFAGANQGLVVAEIELGDEAESFPRPAWIGDEVSHDPRYYNVSLVRHPYTQW